MLLSSNDPLLPQVPEISFALTIDISWPTSADVPPNDEARHQWVECTVEKSSKHYDNDAIRQRVNLFQGLLQFSRLVKSAL